MPPAKTLNVTLKGWVELATCNLMHSCPPSLAICELFYLYVHMHELGWKEKQDGGPNGPKRVVELWIEVILKVISDNL